MPILGIPPVKFILRLFRLSDDFNNNMVLPLLAVFLGTGNRTPTVSSVLWQRLFNDPQMKLWVYDPDTMLPNLAEMYTFPNLGEFYQTWAKDLRVKSVDIRLSSLVAILERVKKRRGFTSSATGQRARWREILQRQHNHPLERGLFPEYLRSPIRPSVVCADHDQRRK